MGNVQRTKARRAPGPVSLLGQALKAVRAVSGRLLLLIIATQLVITVIAFPLITWVFREALRANGMYALDTANFSFGAGFPLTLLLLFIIVFLVLLLVVAQFSMYLVVLHYPQRSARQLLTAAAGVLRKTARASSIPLALYLLVVLPLSGFGFTSALVRGISVPNFVTGELEKEPLYAALMVAFYLALAYLNLRLSLTMPVFVFSKATGTASIAASWRMTRGIRSWPILVAVALILLCLALLSVAVLYVMLVPTLITDTLVPQASPVTAAVSLGIANVAFLILTGLAVALLAGVLTSFAKTRGDLVATDVPEVRHQKSRRPHAIAVAVGVVAATVLGALSLPTLNAVADHPETIILAHRGFTKGGVENTIEALEAANAAGAEIVEFDTMQTKDGQFVVIHDTNLERLAGIKAHVKDLTLDELVQITVKDEQGHTGKIPSLVDYVTRANELDQPLLIEIKLSGAETETHVQDLIDVLEDNDLLNGHIFHTLDYASAQTLKTLRPDSTIGYIMPFAALGVPDTHADFLVLEESSAKRSMQNATGDAGLGYFVWTVNSDDAINLRLRQGVDAIITDHPDRALAARQRIDQETGLAGRLHDIMLSFVGG